MAGAHQIKNSALEHLGVDGTLTLTWDSEDVVEPPVCGKDVSEMAWHCHLYVMCWGKVGRDPFVQLSFLPCGSHVQCDILVV